MLFLVLLDVHKLTPIASLTASAGGAARLAGGIVRLSGWAIGSLGEAIENSGHSGAEEGEHQRLAPKEDLTSGNPRVLKRQVAGSSVRLIGDAIDQVAGKWVHFTSHFTRYINHHA